MKEQDFILNYIIQYVSNEMARKNWDAVQPADLAQRFTKKAMVDGKDAWDFYCSQQQATR